MIVLPFYFVVNERCYDGRKLKYEGNIIIGDDRSYADMFAIIDDAAYTKINGEEKSVGVLKFDKNPAKGLPKQGSAHALPYFILLCTDESVTLFVL